MAIRADGAEQTRYIVLGIGVLSVPRAMPSDVVATQMTAVGLAISGQPGLKVGLGYSFSTVLAIPHEVRDATVEVATCRADGLRLHTRSYEPTTSKEEP